MSLLEIKNACLKLDNKKLQQIPLVEGEEKAQRLFLNNNEIYNIESKLKSLLNYFYHF